MTEFDATRSLAVPVGLLLAGMILGFLAVAWLALGTEPLMDDDATTAATVATGSNGWLPLTAGVLSLAALWAGLRSLTHPRHS